jgi:TRAP-type uncharacterized transport system fused permease subunit
MKTLGEKIRENKAYVVVMIFGLAMAAYHLISTQILLQAAKPHLNTHLGFALTLVFLWEFAFNKGKLQRLVPLILALLALACTGYVQIFWEELENRAYFNTPLDLVIGVLIIILVLEATRRNFGLILPLLTLLIVLYPFVGKYFPEPFRCQALDLDQTISNLSIGIQNGIYGIVLPTSANYIFFKTASMVSCCPRRQTISFCSSYSGRYYRPWAARNFSCYWPNWLPVEFRGDRA